MVAFGFILSLVSFVGVVAVSVLSWIDYRRQKKIIEGQADMIVRLINEKRELLEKRESVSGYDHVVGGSK